MKRAGSRDFPASPFARNIKIKVMKREKFFSGALALSVLGLLASSCSLVKQIPIEPRLNEDWVGASHRDIVMNFGAPDRTESDGADGSILVYEKLWTERTAKVDTSGIIYDRTITEDIVEHRYYTDFFLDSEGICYHVKSNRELPDPRSKKINTIVWSSVGGAVLLGGLISFVASKAAEKRMFSHF